MSGAQGGYVVAFASRSSSKKVRVPINVYALTYDDRLELAGALRPFCTECRRSLVRNGHHDIAGRGERDVVRCRCGRAHPVYVTGAVQFV
jgi:hypothetical protein